jgi:glutathione S-transferase
MRHGSSRKGQRFEEGIANSLGVCLERQDDIGLGSEAQSHRRSLPGMDQQPVLEPVYRGALHSPPPYWQSDLRANRERAGRYNSAMLKFFFAYNTVSLASHIALEQAGADYELVKIDFKKDQQKAPEYLKVNPKARMPALVTERGILTETPAILAYVAQSYPKANLAPIDDPFAFAQVQAFNSYLCSTVHIAHAHRMRGYRWADDEAAFESMRKKVPQSVGECFQLIEREMLKGPWVMGKDLGICDFYLFTLAQWLESDGVDLTKIPRVMEHRARVGALPVVKKAIAAEMA